MAKTHVVGPGEWLGVIASRYGFGHWAQLWEYEANAALRGKRSSPDLVMVGDEVVIPERERRRGATVATNRRVVFQVRPRDRLRLRVAGIGPMLAALGPIDYSLEAGSQRVEGRLEADGQLLEVLLDRSVDTAVLTLMGTVRHEFHVGGLGPAGEERGALARLTNLGYDPPALSSPEERSPAGPVAAFQLRVGLPVTGELDVETVAALRTAYGD